MSNASSSFTSAGIIGRNWPKPAASPPKCSPASPSPSPATISSSISDLSPCVLLLVLVLGSWWLGVPSFPLSQTREINHLRRIIRLKVGRTLVPVRKDVSPNILALETLKNPLGEFARVYANLSESPVNSDPPTRTPRLVFYPTECDIIRLFPTHSPRGTHDTPNRLCSQ